MGKQIRIIKTILKVPSIPNINFISLMVKRLLSCNEHIVTVKESYNPKFELTKVNLTHKITIDVPNWFKPLCDTLQLYLDVIIIKDKVLLKRSISPVHTLAIIGEHFQILLAVHYIDYIFTTISLITDDQRIEYKKKNKQDRRNQRKGIDIKKSDDTRIFASKFRYSLLYKIINSIDNLLDDIKNNHEYAFNKGIDRQGRINEKLILKYSKTWKQKLFKTNFNPG